MELRTLGKVADEVDVWGTDWARQRRIMLGIIPGDKMASKERIGKARCTLADLDKTREAPGGGGIKINELGHRDQHWPEVYSGLSYTVHQAYLLMPHDLRTLMDLHYVWCEIAAPAKARWLGVSLAQYWISIGHMKSFLHGAVVVNRNSKPVRAALAV